MAETRELGKVRIDVEGAKASIYVGSTAVRAIRRDAGVLLGERLDEVWEALSDDVEEADFEKLRLLHSALSAAKDAADILVALAPLPDDVDDPA